MSYSVVSVTSDIDMDTGSFSGYDYYVVDCSSGNITISLPTISYDGNHFKIHRVDTTSNTLNLISKPHQTVNNSLSFNLTLNCECVSFGTNYIAA